MSRKRIVLALAVIAFGSQQVAAARRGGARPEGVPDYAAPMNIPAGEHDGMEYFHSQPSGSAQVTEDK